MRTVLASLLVLSAAALPAVSESADDAIDSAEQEVVEVVEAAYIHGAFNEQNTEAMRAGFHPIFEIHGQRNGELSTYPIDEWVKGIEKAKAAPDYEPQVWEHEFPIIDVTGDAAVVKVELYRVENGERAHVFTDYLSLLRLDDGWKITDKVYHRH
jgi:hypothetical protein